ncbi:hypothetical protein SAMN04488589_0221 [Methanolobus vulcani]|uniref:DUF5652 domain-containing protein n=1 Tax=Methanolobus vulcani TaxID=38026 RepID=A0A7Z7AWZ1_9EURY|nr:DUF5652 family protein [Methanolobus vulcani]MDK2947788.1 hypothetical protein [Methanolobus sp.]SDF28158.1 hypothetical protein SAMN04488589_0221 [Methanolobus vulcani]
MLGMTLLSYQSPAFMAFFIVLVLWEVLWKGVGLWKAARNDDKYWFIAILIINTLGILPILYIYIFRKSKKGI